MDDIKVSLKTVKGKDEEGGKEGLAGTKVFTGDCRGDTRVGFVLFIQ